MIFFLKYCVGTIANIYSAVRSRQIRPFGLAICFFFGRPVFIYSAVRIRPSGLVSISNGQKEVGLQTACGFQMGS